MDDASEILVDLREFAEQLDANGFDGPARFTH